MSQGHGMKLRRQLLAALIAACAFATAAFVAPPVARAAAPALTYVSDTHYTLDPAKNRVHVASSITASARGDPGSPTRSYWDGVVVTVPPSTAGFAASLAGKPLPLKVQATSSSNVILAVGFGRRIYSGQSLTFDLQFDVVDHETATDRDLRLMTTLSSFPVFGLSSADASGSTVTVAFPPGYHVTEQEGDLQIAPDATGRTVYSGRASAGGGLYAWFVAETTPKLVTTELKEGGLHITIARWADDPAWGAAVSSIVNQGYAWLRNSIGLGDLPEQTLTIEETSLRQTAGYNGELDVANARMNISYYADPYVILHELAHLWFNNTISSERWINEGFASYYAEHAVVGMGLTPRSPQLTDRKIAARVPLENWASAAEPGSLEEQYAYAASLHVASMIADSAGAEDMRAVWNRISTGLRPSEPLQPPQAIEPLQAADPSPGPVDWRSFLDYLEASTGKSFEQIWHDWVVNPEQANLLSQRTPAQEAYGEAVAAAGGWSLPPEIRTALRAWDFTTAQADIGAVMRALAIRQLLATRATQEGTTYRPDLLRAAFEQSVAAGTAEADGELAALDSINAARLAQADGQGAGPAVGLTGRDPVEQLAAARAAFAAGDWRTALALADDARLTWDDVTNAGRNRAYSFLGMSSFLFVALLLALVLPRRRAAS